MATLARSCGRVGAISRHIRAPIQARMFSASAAAGPVTATFVTTAGSFKAELMTDTMPITTSNFIDLCQSGFYDGVHFHRVRISALYTVFRSRSQEKAAPRRTV
jgi:hypothetical protein